MAALALLLGFFFPWFDVLISISPFKMITGIGSYALQGSEVFLYPIPICAVLLLLNEFSDSAPLRGIEKLLKITPLISWGLFTLIVKNKLSSLAGSEGGALMLRGLVEVAEFGFYLTVIGVGWLFLLFFTPNKKPLHPSVSNAVSAGIPVAPVLAPPTVAVPSMPPPHAVPAGPTAAEELGKVMVRGSLLLVRNWRIALVTTSILFVVYLFYALLIRANPAKEGKALAQKFCDCQQQNIEAQIRLKQAFVTKQAGTPGTQEALRDSLLRIEEKYEMCQQDAKAAVNSKLGDYLSDSENATELQQAIQANRALWTSPDSIQLRNIDTRLTDAGYNKYGHRFTDKMSVGSDESNSFSLFGNAMGDDLSGHAILELSGWHFDAKPYPEFLDERSGSARFKISVSESGEVLAAVKISGFLSARQEQECRKALLSSTLMRTYSGTGGATGIVSFDFEAKDNGIMASGGNEIGTNMSALSGQAVEESDDYNLLFITTGEQLNFTGTVGNQSITAKLMRESYNNISGSYTYPDHPNWPVYILQGVQTDAGNIRLSEFTRGKKSAECTLSQEGSCLTGTMYNTDGRQFPMRFCVSKEATQLEPKKVYTYVDQMPDFPGGGGEAAISEAIEARLRYSPTSIQNHEQGSVTTSFTVSANGTISDVKITRGMNTEINEAVVAAVKALPQLVPGRQNGQAVDVSYKFAITIDAR